MMFHIMFITNQILLKIANFLNKGIFIDVKVIDNECAVHRKHEELGRNKRKIIK